jgi:t-SNARE complex subunit (syntaxin)
MFEQNSNQEQPLIENENEKNLKILEELYLKINKDLKTLEKIFNTDNNELPFEQNNYKKCKIILQNNFNKIFSLDKILKNSENENLEIKNKIKKKLENIKNINKKFNDFEYYIENLEKRMIEHVPFYQSDLINTNYNLIDNNNNNNDNNNENDEFNNIQIKVYQNSEAMLKRTEQLENIKNISSTVAQLSDDIKTEVYNQGDILNNIEENVEKVEENTTKGLKEIKETEIITKKSKKNLYFLSLIILFLIGLIIYYLTKLF